MTRSASGRESGAFHTRRTLAEQPAVRTLIDVETNRVNAQFARVENIRRFVILAKELDHNDGELTATMNVRRRIVKQRFHEEIMMIYGETA
jgi:long-chain acyl-CoA synthetase